MATKELPAVRAEPETDVETFPVAVPYQSVIWQAHQRALDRK